MIYNTGFKLRNFDVISYDSSILSQGFLSLWKCVFVWKKGQNQKKKLGLTNKCVYVDKASV